jgi:hypothetical protein
MSLRSPTEHEMRISVRPPWIAGIQVRRMRPETSMSIWIPALHAGMTQSRGFCLRDIGPSGRIFKRGHEEYKVDFENSNCEIRFSKPFVGFVRFVV